MTRARRAQSALNQQLMQLGVAAPAVITQRMTRMAIAGLSPTARDHAECSRMVSEKWSAGMQAWNAMAMQSLAVGTSAGLHAMSLWMPWAAAGLKPLPSAQDAWMEVASAGLRPILRTARANQRRLGKTKA